MLSSVKVIVFLAFALIIAWPLISRLLTWIRVIFFLTVALTITRPLIKHFVLAYKNGVIKDIGRTTIIGDSAFVSDCEKFALKLQEMDPVMYDGIFIQNKFTFIQYSLAKYKISMIGEYAVPAGFQTWKAMGVGAWMVFGFFCTQTFGRSLIDFYRSSRFAKKNDALTSKKTYAWLVKHQFRKELLRPFIRYAAANNGRN